MDQIIQINNYNGKSVVSARKLHEFLKSKREFATWIKQRIQKFGFVENEDFIVFDKFVKNSTGGRPPIEYALTLDMAKELSMVEANEKGRQARRYFIDQEKKLQELKHQLPGMIDMVVEKVLDRLEFNSTSPQLNSPVVLYYSVTEYIRENRRIKQYFTKWDIMDISKRAKKMCESLNLEIINKKSDKWENGINTYPENILEEVLNDFLSQEQ